MKKSVLGAQERRETLRNRHLQVQLMPIDREHFGPLFCKERNNKGIYNKHFLLFSEMRRFRSTMNLCSVEVYHVVNSLARHNDKSFGNNTRQVPSRNIEAHRSTSADVSKAYL